MFFVRTREALAPSPLAAGAADLTRHELRCTVQGRIPRSSFFRAQMIEIERERAREREKENKHFLFTPSPAKVIVLLFGSVGPAAPCASFAPCRGSTSPLSPCAVGSRRDTSFGRGNLPCPPEATQVVDCLCLCMHKELRLLEDAVAWRNNPGAARESPASSAIAGP